MNINALAKIDLKTKPLLIIFDSHNLIYRSYFAVPKLHDKHNRPTNAIQGTCSILLKFLQNYPEAYFCIASDSKGGNFRHKLYGDYKAHRKELEDDLLQQIIVMPKFYEALGMKVMAAEGYEADDFIASLVSKLKASYTILIASSDKDLTQLLVQNDVMMIDPTKETFMDSDFVLNKFGVDPSRIKDYLSLVGDSSDNIPGAKSVGPKTAIKILQYGTLDQIIGNPEIVEDKKLRQTVINNLDSIILSEKLVRLVDNIEIDINLEDITIDLSVQADKLYKLFGEYDLRILQKRIEKFIQKKPSGDETATEEHLTDKTIERIIQTRKFGITFVENKYKIASEGRIYLVDNIYDIKTLIESSSIKKIVYGAASMEKQLAPHEIKLDSVYDLALLYYHLIGVKANNSLLDILYFTGMEDIGNNLDHQKNGYLVAFENLFDQGIQQLFSIKHIHFFEEDRKIHQILRSMEQEGILIDKNALENLGIYFEKFLKSIKEQIVDLTGYDFNILSPKQTSEILFDKLELKPTKKSKNEGVFSTNHTVLEELSEDGIEVADCILQYRSLYKLKSSYCDSLAEDINLLTGRIHTTFELNGATTGRVLSSKPNLQNIPTKTEEGRKIRSCFIAKEGHQLISADYSQIELRILAHIAGVKNLQATFENGEDVHKLTAHKVFRIPLDQIDDFWRSKAKAINFGIIYGISPFGLSRQLKISHVEANQIIKDYLNQYREINNYLEETKAFANKYGFVETAFGRRCNLRSSSAEKGGNYHEKQFLERAAINAPIQGTASDIIKTAMIKINNFITNENLKSKILLQIHDELIFETQDDEVECLKSNLSNIMKNTGKTINLPLEVTINSGKNWMEL